MRLSTPAALLSLLPIAALCGAGATYLVLAPANVDTPRRSPEPRAVERSTQSADPELRTMNLMRATGARAVSVDVTRLPDGPLGAEGDVELRLTIPAGTRETFDGAAVSALIEHLAHVPPRRVTRVDPTRGRIPHDPPAVAAG